jgi:hypothetical protein
MANEDADGAAMAMGRAALMALHLAKRETDGLRSQMFQGAEHLFRSQEHGYRALALFRRAGGDCPPRPASAEVSGSLKPKWSIHCKCLSLPCRATTATHG